MTDYLTEQEQVQQLKNWVKQYGPTVIVGIVLAFIITSGWHYWQNYRNKMLYHASSVYDEMLMMRAQGNIDNTNVQAQKLISHYPRTPYAQMASFMLARDAVNKNNFAEAHKNLDWVIKHAGDKSIKQIARIRKARVYIAEKKPDDAINLLEKENDKTFLGLIDEVRGDAFLAKNDLTAARQAYKQALSELPNGESTRPILQMKFDNLATAHS